MDQKRASIARLQRESNQKTYFPRLAWKILAPVLVVAVASLIFIIRGLDFLHAPNFYAEDGTIIFNNLYTLEPLRAILAGFNGYLIVGQYLLAGIAIFINFFFGGDIASLPLVTGLVSCVFLGLTASLPFLLFRKELGTILSLIIVMFTALTPMFSSDYAIIGTLGNLKFAFLYIAFMLVIYRIYRAGKLSDTKVILTDLTLLLCVVTNVTCAFLVPLVMLPHVKKLFYMLRARSLELSTELTSGVALSLISVLYVALALIKGIPELPGYLDGPFKLQALFPILERTTTYAWSYPITASFNTKFVLGLLLFIGLYLLARFIKKRQDRALIFVMLWALALGTGLFILNRPGVGDYYLMYGHRGGPDQFFYAQNMIVIFATGWLFKDRIKKLVPKQRIFGLGAIVIYLLLAIPNGSSFGGSAVVYSGMKPIEPNVKKACANYKDQERVIIQIYPTPYWQWHVDKDLACKS